MRFQSYLDEFSGANFSEFRDILDRGDRHPCMTALADKTFPNGRFYFSNRMF